MIRCLPIAGILCNSTATSIPSSFGFSASLPWEVALFSYGRRDQRMTDTSPIGLGRWELPKSPAPDRHSLNALASGFDVVTARTSIRTW